MRMLFVLFVLNAFLFIVLEQLKHTVPWSAAIHIDNKLILKITFICPPTPYARHFMICHISVMEASISISVVKVFLVLGLSVSHKMISIIVKCTVL